MHPRNSSQKDENYALQGIMNVHLNPFDKTVDSYFIVVGRKYNILQILDGFISNIDNLEYVNVVVFPLEKDNSTKNKSNDLTRFVQFGIHRDDIPLIGKKVPIRITCTTDAFLEDKEAFVDFFKELRSIMQY